MRVHTGVYIYHMCIIDPVYAYVYICVYIHMYLYTHIYVYVNVYICMYMLFFGELQAQINPPLCQGQQA